MIPSFQTVFLGWQVGRIGEGGQDRAIWEYCFGHLESEICVEHLGRNWGLPGGSVVKNPPANAGNNRSSIPGSGRFPGEGNGNPLQYSCLENPMNRRAWWAIVCVVQRVGQD